MALARTGVKGGQVIEGTGAHRRVLVPGEHMLRLGWQGRGVTRSRLPRGLLAHRQHDLIRRLIAMHQSDSEFLLGLLHGPQGELEIELTATTPERAKAARAVPLLAEARRQARPGRGPKASDPVFESVHLSAHLSSLPFKLILIPSPTLILRRLTSAPRPPLKTPACSSTLGLWHIPSRG
jgi:hypothetical protein